MMMVSGSVNAHVDSPLSRRERAGVRGLCPIDTPPALTRTLRVRPLPQERARPCRYATRREAAERSGGRG